MNEIALLPLAPSWPLPDEDVRAALLAAYADGSWGEYAGPHAAALCEELRTLVGLPHVSLCSSGTIAVELALRGLKLGAGDEVILAAYDFPGNFRAIEAVGATPVLVDLAPQSWRMNVDELPTAAGPQTRAILVSHLHGDLADMPRICQFAAQRGLAVLEDCCQVPGATVAGQPAGSWGDVGVFSFGGSKLLTAGRGGALVTARDDVHQRIRIANDRGNQAFPLSELQAAVLFPQVRKLPKQNACRLASVRHLVSQRDSFLSLTPLAMSADAEDLPAFYKLPFFLGEPAQAGIAPETWRTTWIAALQSAGLAIDEGFRGFVRRSNARCRRVGELPQAQLAADRTLLWHHPILLEPEPTLTRAAAALAQVCYALSAHE